MLSVGGLENKAKAASLSPQEGEGGMGGRGGRGREEKKIAALLVRVARGIRALRSEKWELSSTLPHPPAAQWGKAARGNVRE